MTQYFELDQKEKKQEWLLLTLAILFFITIAIGIYYQSSNKDHDEILVPLFFILGSCFYLVYSINAFGKGNLIQKWTPFYIYKILFFLRKRLGSSTDDNAKRFAIKFLGIVGLIISIGLFTATIKSTGII